MNKKFSLALTAQAVQDALLSIDNKIDTSDVVQNLQDPATDKVPSAKAVADSLAIVSGDFGSLGSLAFESEVNLSGSRASGTLPINKGGTGGTTAQAARSALGVLTAAEIDTKIEEAIPEIQTVDLTSSQVQNQLPISSGGTGASSQSQARSNLSVDSTLEVTEKTLRRAVQNAGKTWKGYFSLGFEITSYDHIGVDGNGDFWEYIGPLPFTVAATLNPVADNRFIPWKLLTEAKHRKDLNEKFGYNEAGYFKFGFTYTNENDVGVDSSGNSWLYVGGDTLPVTITAATDPSVSSDFSLVDIDTKLKTKDGYTTDEILNLESIGALFGTRVWLKDRSSWFFVVKSSTLTGDGVNLDELTSVANPNYGLKLDELKGCVTLQSLGAIEGYTGDATQQYDRACELLKLSNFNGGVVVWPNYDLFFSKIVLRDRIGILGYGQDVSNSLPLEASTPTGNQDNNYGFVEQDTGRVRGVHIENVSFWGNTTKVNSDIPRNTDQWAFYLKATYNTTTNDGGLWDFSTKDVRCAGWKYGLWSRGGYTTSHSRLPQQWWKAEKFSIVCSDTTGEPIRMTGQHGQISFIGNGRAEFAFGGSASDNYNIKIDWDPNPSEVVNDGVNGESSSDVSGTGNAVRTPSNVQFKDGFTIQLGYGVYARNNKGCILNGAWFENCQGVAFADSTGHIALSNCHIASSGQNDGGTGYIQRVGSNASIDWGVGNDIFGGYDNFFVSVSGTQRKAQFSHDGWASTDGQFTTGAPTIAIANDIDVKGNQFVNINCNDQTVDLLNIDSTLCPSMHLHLKVVNGNLRLRNTGNIRFPTGFVSTKVFPNNSTVTLVRAFDSKAWNLVIPDIPFYNSAEPTDGFYYHIGTIIYNTSAGVGEVHGWKCNVSGLAGSTASFNEIGNIQ